MEQFNHKIIKLKKELIGITLDLNNFKTNNHRTITKIIDNLSTIENKSKKQTINTLFPFILDFGLKSRTICWV